MSLLLNPQKDTCKTDLGNSFHQDSFDIYWHLPVLLVSIVFSIKMFFLIKQQVTYPY